MSEDLLLLPEPEDEVVEDTQKAGTPPPQRSGSPFVLGKDTSDSEPGSPRIIRHDDDAKFYDSYGHDDRDDTPADMKTAITMIRRTCSSGQSYVCICTRVRH